VTVAIRPEAIRLSADQPASGENVLPASVASATFLGNLMDYQLDLDGLRLRAQADRWARFPVGAPLWATLPVDECVIM
jgi:hypothetical protein